MYATPILALNAKKIDSPTAWVDKNIVARTDGRVYEYSVADLLDDVKGVFKDTFSEDVYKHFGMKRKANDFSKNLLYESRTAELTDEQVIERLLERLKSTGPEFEKLKSYNKLSYFK